MKNSELYAISPVYYHQYFDLVQTNELMTELAADQEETIKLFSSVPVDKEHFAYQEGKWNVTQVLRHIIDCERIFSYRALRFARFDTTNLAGFDENFYMSGHPLKQEKLGNLIEEFKFVRQSSISLFQSCNDEMLDFQGTANNLQITARAIGFCLIGHNTHHRNILKERYL